MLRQPPLSYSARKRGGSQHIKIGIALGIILGLLFRLLIHSFILFPYTIKNNTMEPSLPQGKSIYIWRCFFCEDLKRGDLVYLRHPNTDEYTMIRRIAALPGEEISIQSSRIYINGKVLEENWEKKIQKHYSKDRLIGEDLSQRQFMPKIRIKEDEFFVLADNRKIALDSRLIGIIPLAQVDGFIK